MTGTLKPEIRRVKLEKFRFLFSAFLISVFCLLAFAPAPVARATRAQRKQKTPCRAAILLAVLLAVLFSPGAAQAACSLPPGNAGDLIYNKAYHVPTYCNGTTWRAMGPQGTGGANKVFITSAIYSSNIWTTGGGDVKCMARAAAGGLSGTYKAWFAVTAGVDDPATTFIHSTLPYQDIDANTIANNWAGLTSGTLLHAINVNELNSIVTSSVWTNVNTDGTATVSGSQATNCNGFTNTSATSAPDGDSGATNSTWTAAGTGGCGIINPEHLYCIQQITGCTSPAGNEGDLIYNSAFHLYQFCGGDAWYPMGPQSTGGYNTVFVTSSAFAGGAIGSVAGANADCAASATAASLPGTYKAWIAVTTGVDDPATTFTQSTIPYKEVGGTVIASNWAGLISGTLTNGITLDETGTTASGGVWTNVATNGTAIVSGSSATNNCTAWTVLLSSGSVGATGSATATWTNNGTSLCKAISPQKLYCFQQNVCTSPAGNERDMIYNSASNVMQYCNGTGWVSTGM